MIFDWVCLVIIGLFAFWGMYKGLLKEFKQKAGIITGLLAAVLFTGPLTQSFSGSIIKFKLGIWGSIIIAVLLILIGFISAKFLAKILETMFDKFNMRSVDHFLGAIFGAFGGTLIVVALIYILRLQTVIPMESIFIGSKVLNRLWPIVLWLVKFDTGGYTEGFKVVL